MLRTFATAFVLTCSLVPIAISCGTPKTNSSIQQNFSDPQDFANQEIYHHFESELDSLEKGTDSNARQKLPLMLLEAQFRLDTLQSARERLMNYDGRFLKYLEESHLPRIQSMLLQRGIEVSGRELEDARHEAVAEIEPLTRELRAALASRQNKDSYLVNRLFELLAFSRSETLGDGRIGSWNPADVTTIQGSASAGLSWVLDQIHSREHTATLSFEELMRWHRALLGQAEHHFSHGGVINEIYFVNDQGTREHVSEMVRRWIDEVNVSRGGIIDSLRLYANFLHMHPFGDSNGRIAEVGKVLVSSKSKLLPLITREKTSVENYLFQRLYGIGLYEREAVKQAQETLDVYRALMEVTGGEELTGVDLEGSNIIFSFRKQGELQIGILNRSYLFNPDVVGMPPIRGAPVLLESEDPAASFRIRVTSDKFKTSKDLLPHVVVQTERLGRMKMIYPIFLLPIEDEQMKKQHHFQFLYDHPQSGEVIWHNNGLNYTIENPSALAIQNPSQSAAAQNLH